MAKLTQADQIRKLEDQMKEMQSNLQAAEAALLEMRNSARAESRGADMKRKRRERTSDGVESEDGDGDLEKEASKWVSHLDRSLHVMQNEMKLNSLVMEKRLTNLFCKMMMSREDGRVDANANVDAGLEDESGLWGFVNPCDLFKLLLQSYLEKEGLSQKNQELVLAGKESLDGRILKVSCAYRESTLHLAMSLSRRKVYTIIAKTLTGKAIVLKVTHRTTIYDLKEKIWDKEGILHRNKGKQLGDEKPVEYYGIVDGSVLSLILRLSGGVSYEA